jgi:hypothetical protein
MWTELKAQDNLKRVAEIMAFMNDRYQVDLTATKVANLLRKDDAHIYYYSDGSEEVVLAICFKALLGAHAVLMAGYTGNAKKAALILAAKVATLIVEKGHPFYTTVPVKNTPYGDAFYQRIPAITGSVGGTLKTLAGQNGNTYMFRVGPMDSSGLEAQLAGVLR